MHEALILEVLRKYSDENHRLSQGDIIARLRSEFGVTMERKAIKRNLANLQQAGFGLECDESARINAAGEEEILCANWYITRPFSDAELRLLIDSVLFSKHIPQGQGRALIAKLEQQSNVYFQARTKHIHAPPGQSELGKQIFYTIEVLDEAISLGRKVAFHYGTIDLDRQIRLRPDDHGKPKQYCVNPYRMAASNGRYYLICNMEPHDNVVHFRLDRIRDIRLLEAPVKPMKQVRGLEQGLRLPEHMAEHLYMFSGESVRVKFLAERGILDDVFDWFGTDIRLKALEGGTVSVSARVNERAMFCWAMQYGPHVEVLEPKGLRERIAKAAGEMAVKYNQQQEEPS